MNTFANKQSFLIITVLASIICGSTSAADKNLELVTEITETDPIVDGNDLDPCWASAKAITAHDRIADIDITLKALYSKKKVFLLVSFPDPNESRTHKSWVWDKNQEFYKTGTNIEDTFVFKWNMNPKPVDLSVLSDSPYTADVWFWKACRTDPVGYADDKIQVLAPEKSKKSHLLTSRSGDTMYLLRKGDKGTTAFKTEMIINYKGDVVDRFVYRQPKGSCADVKAKGKWKDGRWTIEFARELVTGNDDDIQFDLNKKPQFGISRYEIRGGKVNKKLSQPLYECGDTNENIFLVFKKKK